ncbi:MAG: hypothetical protein PVH12_04600 [Candidatus Bathyarchaeota archaeon]|jgi:hypothetical protein
MLKKRHLKKLLGAIILAIFCIVVLLTFMLSPFTSMKAYGRVIHDPIFIEGNEDFIAQATGKWDVGGTADGSTGNPYIIEELIIDGPGQQERIYIDSTDLHFRIINCS